jgi:hypothetical protein
MRFEAPVHCAKCYIRIETYELRTVHYKRTYHRHCFVKLVREANQEKQQQSELAATGVARLRFA